MTLSELNEKVEKAIELAKDSGENPDEITVSLQLDNFEGEVIWSAENLHLFYDNNINASGCVIGAFING